MEKKSFDLNCPWLPEINAYMAGELEENRCLFFEKHLQDCFICREQLSLLCQLEERLSSFSVEPVEDLSSKILEKIPEDAWEPRFTFWKVACLLLISVCLSFASGYFFRESEVKFSSHSKLSKKTHKKSKSVLPKKPLTWLASRQQSDGAWDVEKLGGKKKYQIAITAFALLAFMENKDRLPKQYYSIISKGIDYLQKQQNSDGLFGPDFNHCLYNHAIVTYTLQKAYTNKMGKKSIHQSISKALKYICQSQNEWGSWGNSFYSERADISIALWQLKVLKLAQSQGWKNLTSNIKLGKRWLKFARKPEASYSISAKLIAQKIPEERIIGGLVYSKAMEALSPRDF